MESTGSRGCPRGCPICGRRRGSEVAEPDGFPLVRCADCGMVYAALDESFALASNRSTDAGPLINYYRNEPIETIEFYDRIIRDLVRHFGTSSLRVLEFGCGSGMFLRRCRKVGLVAKGIDHSGYARLAGEAFDLDVACTDLASQPFAGEEFDVVFSHATFEHVVCPMEEAERLVALLRPGGLFLTTGVPNYNTFTIRVLGSFWNNAPPGHLNFFTPRTLEKMYRTLGLSEVRTWTYGFNMWYLQHRLRALWPPAKTGTPAGPAAVPPAETRREILEQVRRLDTGLETHEVPWPRVLTSRIYTWARWPGAGSCACARGVKPEVRTPAVG